MISICRERSKNSRTGATDGAALGMLEARKQFLRINGHQHLPAYGPRSNGKSPSPLSVLTVMMRQRSLMITRPPPKLHGTRDILPSSAA
jgi:hypothetical protein